MRKKQTDIADLISNDRTAEARAFLSELDKTDRMADRLAGGIEVSCPTAGDIVSEIVDSLGGNRNRNDTIADLIGGIADEKLKPLETMLRAICAHLKIETDD